jgi:hypothetical protein
MFGWKGWALGASLLTLGSCAVGTGGNPPPRSMTAARAALAAEYRIFYDALNDYGDWVLIEPFGYLFRPRTDFHDWRPYEQGFWAPTDAFGWVWISSEPFGWATYHYGRWFYDDFQGWVWQPGLQWAPAWVSWQMNDQYVGWAPLFPEGRRFDGTVPGGRYVFTSLQAMGSTDLNTRIFRESQLGERVAATRPVNETEVVDGVRIPTGPAVSLIERATGPLTRVRVDNLLSGAARPGVASGAPDGAEGRAEAGATPEETRQAAEQAAREARVLTARGGKAPSRLSIVKPMVTRRPTPRETRPSPAARDTTRRTPGG